MNDVLGILDGKKTYLAALGGIIATLLLKYGYIDMNAYYDVALIAAFACMFFLRMAIKAVAPESKVVIPEPTVVVPATPPADPAKVNREELIAALRELMTPPPAPPAQ